VIFRAPQTREGFEVPEEGEPAVRLMGTPTRPVAPRGSESERHAAMNAFSQQPPLASPLGMRSGIEVMAPVLLGAPLGK
jgi:hypothetical protein